MAATRDVVAALAAVLVAVFLILSYLCVLGHSFEYILEGGTLKIRLWGVTVRQVRIQEVYHAEVIRWRDVIALLPVVQIWGGYNGSGRGVLIKKHTGIIRKLIISPREPEEFVKLLRGPSHKGLAPS